jgi:hypothetical protein
VYVPSFSVNALLISSNVNTIMIVGSAPNFPDGAVVSHPPIYQGPTV